MPRKATTMALSLTEEARSTLAALARSRTAPAHHVERSAIILHLMAVWPRLPPVRCTTS